MENQLCKIHNDPAILVEKDCRFCVQESLKIKNIDDVNNEEKSALKQLEMQFDQNIKQLKDFAEVLEQFTQQIQYELEKFKQYVEQIITHVIEKKNKVKNISNNFTKLQLNKTNEEKKTINNSFTQIVEQINNQIKELEICIKLDKIYQSITQNFKLQYQNFIKEILENQKQLRKQDDFKKFKEIDKKIDYQLMQKSSYKQNESCYAIAFNKDATIMVADCDQLIKVFEFKDDQLKELQSLSGHSDNVYCLKFMKTSNQFISGSCDSTMMIWEQNQNQLWVQFQILKSHTNSIMCITISQNEDMLISGSIDRTIKFWKKQNNTWSFDQSIDCQNIVWSISLNDQQDELLASVDNEQILVLQLQGKEWKIKQNIQVEQYGLRLCFINQNQFVFQPYCEQNLQIFFNYIDQDQNYHSGQVLQYQSKEYDDNSLFPIQYISQIGLMIVKNSKHVHLIKINQNGQFTLEQSINFNTHVLYGSLTDDGKYFATWDEKSKEIQLRKFEV